MKKAAARRRRGSRQDRRRVREIMIKLREGDRLEQVRDRSGVTLLLGGSPLRAFRSLVGPRRILRQSYPLLVQHLLESYGEDEARGSGLPGAPASLDLFLRLTLLDPADDLAAVLDAVRQEGLVEFAAEVPALAATGPDAEDYADPVTGHQGYLLRADELGVDAWYAWLIRTVSSTGPSGSGNTVDVCDFERGYCDSHPNIPDIDKSRRFGVFDPDAEEHGAMVLGVLGALHDGGDGTPGGTVGLCPHATFWMGGAQPTVPDTSEVCEGSDVHQGLDETLAGLPPRSVLLLEVAVERPSSWSADDAGLTELPVEVVCDTRIALAVASAVKDITVVEAAGNSGGELLNVYDDTGATQWGPGMTPRSGAIVVGAGSDADHSRWTGNYGDRVDCQGWGHGVWTPVCPTSSSHTETPLEVEDGNNQYETSFGGTSSATAMVGGIVACAVGAYHAAKGTLLTLPPERIRGLIRTDGLGSPQPASDASSTPIGPLPDLYRILGHLGILPGLYVREDLMDLGGAATGPVAPPKTPLWNRCPDLVLRHEDDIHLDDTNWMTELPSLHASTENEVYFRLRNAGRGPDSGTYRIYWSRAASFFHPRWWHEITDLQDIPLLAPGAVHSARHVWKPTSFTPPADVALIAVVWPDRNLDPEILRRPLPFIPAEVPERATLDATLSAAASISTDAFLKQMRGAHIAIRSVAWDISRPGDPARFEYALRGVPEGATDFTVEVTSDLPPDTKVKVEPRSPVTSTDVPAIAWGVGSGYSGALETGTASFHLGANQQIVFDIEVTTTDKTIPGQYEARIDQWRGKAHLGRMTFVVVVPPSA